MDIKRILISIFKKFNNIFILFVRNSPSLISIILKIRLPNLYFIVRHYYTSYCNFSIVYSVHKSFDIYIRNTYVYCYWYTHYIIKYNILQVISVKPVSKLILMYYTYFPNYIALEILVSFRFLYYFTLYIKIKHNIHMCM